MAAPRRVFAAVLLCLVGLTGCGSTAPARTPAEVQYVEMVAKTSVLVHIDEEAALRHGHEMCYSASKVKPGQRKLALYLAVQNPTNDWTFDELYAAQSVLCPELGWEDT